MLWARGLWRSFNLTGLLRRPALALGAGSLAEVCPYLTAPATCPLTWGAGSLAEFGPYFALGRDLATFAPGSDSVAGRPLLRGAATLNGSSPRGHETVSGNGNFCAVHVISVCLALTLRWAETGPLLHWARVPLLCPYFALGLGFGACASARVSDPWPFPCEPPLFYIGRTLLVLAAHLGREARALPPSLRARLAGCPGSNRSELCGSFYAPGRVSKALLSQHLLCACSSRACA